MKANIIKNGGFKIDKLKKGQVFKSAKGDRHLIILGQNHERQPYYNVLSVWEDGDVNAFEMHRDGILQTHVFVGMVDTISVSVKVV